jgi:threonylcarbamoyladenosine tRNA methylthiotransferase MtaB
VTGTTGAGVEVVSLGCRLNIAESETIRALLADAGDVVVVNSCAVTEEAVRQTRKTIRKLRRSRPDARLLLTGCAAEVERQSFADMPEVDGLVPNAAKLDARAWNVPEPAVLPPSLHTRAFVAVQNGCDHACTFCVIPQGRGPSRSLTVAQVLAEVERHLAQGAAEVVLTGVDVTSWGHDLPGAPALGLLVESILTAFPTLARLRMSSLDGVEIDERLFDLLAGEQRVMPHLHLSLQHGHDLILKRMKRRHLRGHAVDLVQRLRAQRADIALGADLIAGFPTEDAAMHAANRSIIAELGIVHGHIFPYSPRPGTPAAQMPQVPRDVVRQRAAELRADVAAARDAWLASLIGQPQPFLAEKDGTGHSPAFARMVMPHGTTAGTIVNLTPTTFDEGLLR